MRRMFTGVLNSQKKELQMKAKGWSQSRELSEKGELRLHTSQPIDKRVASPVADLGVWGKKRKEMQRPAQ